MYFWAGYHFYLDLKCFPLKVWRVHGYNFTANVGDILWFFMIISEKLWYFVAQFQSKVETDTKRKQDVGHAEKMAWLERYS